MKSMARGKTSSLGRRVPNGLFGFNCMNEPLHLDSLQPVSLYSCNRKGGNTYTWIHCNLCPCIPATGKGVCLQQERGKHIHLDSLQPVPLYSCNRKGGMSATGKGKYIPVQPFGVTLSGARRPTPTCLTNK